MKQYKKPEAKVVFFDVEDVLTASTGEGGNVSANPPGNNKFDGYDFNEGWL